MELTAEQMREMQRRHWEETFPVIFEPKIPTMDKKLVIEAAIPGWQPTFGGRNEVSKIYRPLL